MDLGVRKTAEQFSWLVRWKQIYEFVKPAAATYCDSYITDMTGVWVCVRNVHFYETYFTIITTYY